tara:strand:+ start:576 stop:869 length:294 start_codon:yes stop_codon:yes gene_type:complete
MDKKLIRYFIDNQQKDKEWAERWNSNHIEFDDYFKYSGSVEEEKPLYEFENEKNWKFGIRHNDIIHDRIQKIRIYKITKGKKYESIDKDINTIKDIT